MRDSLAYSKILPPEEGERLLLHNIPPNFQWEDDGVGHGFIGNISFRDMRDRQLYSNIDIILVTTRDGNGHLSYTVQAMHQRLSVAKAAVAVWQRLHLQIRCRIV